MGHFTKLAAHEIGPGEKTARVNHAAAVPLGSAVQEQITAMMLRRVAGNIYECASDRAFWQVKDGSIIRLVSGEVDSGQSIPAAPVDNPASFLAHVMDDLEF